MIDLLFKYKNTLDYIKSRAPFIPEAGIILGSGSGDFVNDLEIISNIHSSEIPGYPDSTVKGHKGNIIFSEISGKKSIVFQGRIHFYEGISLDQTLLPVLITKELEAQNIILTNACGCINPDIYPGDLVLINGLNTVNISSEFTRIIGLGTSEFNKRVRSFPEDLVKKNYKEASKMCGISPIEGSYWYNKGPCYETKAEIEMIKKSGFDLVGMSTAHEILFALYCGLTTSAFSIVTNYAAGISIEKLSHLDVINTADSVKTKFNGFLKNYLSLLK